jgi:hypothetical protein
LLWEARVAGKPTLLVRRGHVLLAEVSFVRGNGVWSVWGDGREQAGNGNRKKGREVVVGPFLFLLSSVRACLCFFVCLNEQTAPGLVYTCAPWEGERERERERALGDGVERSEVLRMMGSVLALSPSFSLLRPRPALSLSVITTRAPSTHTKRETKRERGFKKG